MTSTLLRQLESFKTLSYDPKHKPSILYTPAEASNISTDTLLKNAKTDYYELCVVDPRLSLFEEKLFNPFEDYKERELYTKQKNDILNKTIKEFLLYLSPFLLLPQASTIIEYLIRNYKIYYYNVDEVMQLILPYHESPIFNKILSTVELNSSLWNCFSVHKAQKKEVNRKFIIDQCAHDKSLLDFINEMPKVYSEKEIKSNTVFSFYTSVIINLIDKLSPESIISSIFSGLKSKNDLNKIAMYPIISQFISTVKLTPKYEKSMLKYIIRSINSNNLFASLLCLLSFINSLNVTNIEISSIKTILNIPYLSKHLEDLKEKYFPIFDSSPACVLLNRISIEIGMQLYIIKTNKLADLPKALPLFKEVDNIVKVFPKDQTLSDIVNSLLNRLYDSGEEAYSDIDCYEPLISYIFDKMSDENNEQIFKILILIPNSVFQSTPVVSSLSQFYLYLGKEAKKNPDFAKFLIRLGKTSKIVWTLLCIYYLEPDCFTTLDVVNIIQHWLALLNIPEKMVKFDLPVNIFEPKSTEERYCILFHCLKLILNKGFDKNIFYQILMFPDNLFNFIESYLQNYVYNDATPILTLSSYIFDKVTQKQPIVMTRSVKIFNSIVKACNSSRIYSLFPTILIALNNVNRGIRESMIDVVNSLISNNPENNTDFYDLKQCIPSSTCQKIHQQLKKISENKDKIELSNHYINELINKFDSAVVNLLYESLLNEDTESVLYKDIQSNLLKRSTLWKLLDGKDIPKKLQTIFFNHAKNLMTNSMTTTSTQMDSIIYEQILSKLSKIGFTNDEVFDVVLHILQPIIIKVQNHKYTLFTKLSSYLTPELYNKLSDSQKSKLFHSLVKMTVSTENSGPIFALIGNFDVNLEMILMDLKEFIKTFDIEQIQTVCSYINIVKNHSNLRYHFEIVYCLFDYYRLLLDQDISNIDVVYGIQSILEGMLSFASQLLAKSPTKEKKRVKLNTSYENSFDLQLLLKGLEEVDIPQPRNTTLLILGSLIRAGNSGILKELIKLLHEILPKLLIKEYDVYYQMILQLVCVTSKIAKEEKMMISFIYLFIENYYNINEEKRLWFFLNILKEIGIADFHWIIILLSLKYSNDEITFFCEELFNNLNVSQQLTAISYILDSLYTIVDEKKFPDGFPGELLISSVTIEYISTQIIFASEQLNTDKFIQKIINEDNQKLQPAFLKICEFIFLFLRLSSSNANNDTEESIQWGKCLDSCYEILNTIKEFLTIPTFIVIINELLTHENSIVRKKALIFFNTKIESERNTLTDNEKMLLLDMLPVLSKSIVTSDDILNQQTSILSIHVLADHLASFVPEKFIDIFDVLIPLLSAPLQLDTSHLSFIGSVFLLLATLSRSLGSLSFQFLPKFVPVLMKTLEFFILNEFVQTESLELLWQSIFSSLASFLSLYTSFMEPYYEQILLISLNRIYINKENKSVYQATQHVLRLLSKNVPIRLLLPCIVSSTTKIKDPKSMISLHEILELSIPELDKVNVQYYYVEIFDYLYSNLDFRSKNEETASIEEINEVENGIVKVFMELVLKISENQLKQLFLRLCEWSKDGTKLDTNKAPLFLLFLYNLSIKLRNIFVPFYGYTLSQIVNLFENYKSKIVEERYSILISLAMKCLYSCCLYDNDGFIDEKRFELIKEPLLLTIDITKVFNKTKGYKEIIKNSVSPCIVQLVRAINNDVIWKTIHHELLLKTRSSSKNVKVAAVQILTDLFTKIGEEYLSLLPETIPYLAELLENGDSDVEKASHSLKKCIESISGEKIDEYLVV